MVIVNKGFGDVILICLGPSLGCSLRPFSLGIDTPVSDPGTSDQEALFVEVIELSVDLQPTVLRIPAGLIDKPFFFFFLYPVAADILFASDPIRSDPVAIPVTGGFHISVSPEIIIVLSDLLPFIPGIYISGILIAVTLGILLPHSGLRFG